MNSSNQSEMSEQDPMEQKNAESDDEKADSEEDELVLRLQEAKEAEEEAKKKVDALKLAKQKVADKKKAKVKEEATKEAEKTFAEENKEIAKIETLLASVEELKKKLADLKAKVRDGTTAIEIKHGIKTEHEKALDDAVRCKSYIPNHIWDKVLQNPTLKIQLSCRLGGDFRFEGPVPYLVKDRVYNSNRELTDLSLESLLKNDDPTKSDIVRTKAGLRYIIEQLYHTSSASMNTHVKVRKLT